MGLLFYNPLSAELNPIRHLLALADARHFVHVSSVRINALYAYMYRECAQYNQIPGYDF